MTESDDWISELRPRIADEVSHIKTRFQEQGIHIGGVAEGTGVGYLYAVGELLVPERNLYRVTSFLRQNREIRLSDDYWYAAPGLAVVSITSEQAVPVILDEMDRVLGPRQATPNHVFTAAQIFAPGEVSPCEPVEPTEVLEGVDPYPAVCPENCGAGVRIYVSDTGLLTDATEHPWLARVHGDDDSLSPAKPGEDLVPYAGHGTFTAGVASCMAPGADIHVSNAFSPAGSALETTFLADLQAALSSGPDIVCLPVTGPTRNNRPPLSFSAWRAQLQDHKGIVCVAAAGNSGSSRVSWPAASPDVLAVGALAADWRSRANFTNHGGWVDAYAPGSNLINAYTTGQYAPQMTPYAGHPVRKFYGMVRRSGSSFSAAIVSGLIAARMWRNSENAADAAAGLLAEARSSARPGVGPVILPYQDTRACRCSGDPHS